MTTITATSILRSRHALDHGNVLSTLLLRYPRPIHAEFMTHRVFSRNSASSRAIPVKKLIQDVIDNPFIPVHWGKNQPGMQAFEEWDAPVILGDTMPRYTNEGAWLAARDSAVRYAQAFADAGYHKQIVNRLLEPFAHITVVVSGTDWSNFLGLRDHPDAEPHIQLLAREVRKCIERDDDIQTLQPGEWHTPFASGPEDAAIALPARRKLSVARCASTSYKTVDGFDMTLDKAIALHDKLVGSEPLHASPTEHVACADEAGAVAWRNPYQSGNFRWGWRQYRKMLPNECL